MASEPSDPHGSTDRDKNDRPGDKQRSESPFMWIGAGFEFAGAVGILALLGYGLDSWLDSEPWGMVGGAMIGVVGGLYNLIKKAIRSNR